MLTTRWKLVPIQQHYFQACQSPKSGWSHAAVPQDDLEWDIPLIYHVWHYYRYMCPCGWHSECGRSVCGDDARQLHTPRCFCKPNNLFLAPLRLISSWSIWAKVVRQEGACVCLGPFFRNSWMMEFEGSSSRAAFGTVSMHRQCRAIGIVLFADGFINEWGRTAISEIGVHSGGWENHNQVVGNARKLGRDRLTIAQKRPDRTSKEETWVLLLHFPDIPQNFCKAVHDVLV